MKPLTDAITRFSLFLLSIISTSSFAVQCDVKFNYGVITSPNQLRFLNTDKTYVQINNGKQLFVQGREIPLNNQQRELLAQYTNGVQSQVEEIVSIAIESVDIGLKAVNKVVGGLTGENSESHQKIQKKFDDLQWRHRRRFNHSDESYYIAPQDFDDFDEIFSGEFEDELEEIITQSLGTILIAVGQAMSNRDEGNSESRASTLDERIELLGKDLEVEITSRAKALEDKANQFCSNLVELNELENKLKQSIPHLTSFDLIDVASHSE